MEALLGAGANPVIRDWKGQSALSMCYEKFPSLHGALKRHIRIHQFQKMDYTSSSSCRLARRLSTAHAVKYGMYLIKVDLLQELYVSLSSPSLVSQSLCQIK